MTADELLPKIAAGHWTLWYRKRCRPDHWHIYSYSDSVRALFEETERMMAKNPGRSALILPPGETPLGVVDVPHIDEGGES